MTYIDGKWSNDSYTMSIGGLSGITTSGFRTSSDNKIYYAEIITPSNTVTYKFLGVATTLNQAWVGSSRFVGAKYVVNDTTLLSDATYGFIINTTTTPASIKWNVNGGAFSQWIPLLDYSNIPITTFRLAVVGSSSGGTTNTMTLNYNTVKYKTSVIDILNASESETVYDFESSTIIDNSNILFTTENDVFSIKSITNYDDVLINNRVTRVIVSTGTNAGGLATLNGIDTIGTNYMWSATNTTTAWITYEFIEPTILSKLGLVSYNASGYEAINRFQLIGSNTGEFNGEEVVLYYGEIKDPTNTAVNNYQINNYIEFKYYRILITSVYYGNGAYDMALISTYLYNKQLSKVTKVKGLSSISLSDVSTYGEGYQSPIILNSVYNTVDYVITNNDNITPLDKNIQSLTVTDDNVLFFNNNTNYSMYNDEIIIINDSYENSKSMYQLPKNKSIVINKKNNTLYNSPIIQSDSIYKFKLTNVNRDDLKLTRRW